MVWRASESSTDLPHAISQPLSIGRYLSVRMSAAIHQSLEGATPGGRALLRGKLARAEWSCVQADLKRKGQCFPTKQADVYDIGLGSNLQWSEPSK